MDSREIKGHARYIEQTILDERLYQRPSTDSLDGHPDRNRSHHDYTGFMLELAAAEKALDDAYKRLRQLRVHFASGAMIPFENVAGAISAAGSLSAQAWAAVHQAIDATATAHHAGTRELTAQRLAVRLAYAAHGATKPRAVRELSKKIIEAVSPPLSMPSESSLSAMVKALKEESS